MPVNGDKGHGGGRPRRRTQAERTAATRQALLGAAQDLFAARGYARTGREDIVRAAGVTRGALYHHFTNKEQLFRAVFESMEAALLTRIAVAAGGGRDPREQLHRGCSAFLDAATDPAVQRVILIDAPSVLGWQEWRAVDARYGLGMMREGLEAAMQAGQIRRQPVTPLAHLLLAALNEAALYIAGAPDPAAARAEIGPVVDGLLARL
jgi:AcrR family transcriptional regulator